MELTSPNILDWWVLANKTRPCKELTLSITLICAGAGFDDNTDTTFEILAVEDSETELLHAIIRLHRLVIQARFSGQDPDPETTKQRTLKLLNLEQPPDVAPSEHLALGVMYMLCDPHDRFSAEGMEVVLSKTRDGHNMLDLAVLQGQTTLVREIARHLLARFQTQALTSESELFPKNLNGDTALDFAKALGHREIEQVLTTILEVAQDFKTNYLQTPKRPLPTLPARRRAESSAEGSPYQPSYPSVPVSTSGRPLPPTPVNDSPSSSGRIDPYESLATITSPPKQRIQTVQAIIENPVSEPSNSAHEYPPPYNNAEAPPMSSGKHQHQQYYPPTNYSPNLHNIPLPMAASPVSGPTSIHGSPSQQPTLLNQQAPDTPYRPLPSTPLQPAAPLPPPKHKVTPVKRPTQFTIPSEDSAPTSSPYGPPLPTIPTPHFYPPQPQPQQPLYPTPVSMPPHDPYAYPPHHSMPVPMAYPTNLPQIPIPMPHSVPMPHHPPPMPYHSQYAVPFPQPHLPTPYQLGPLARGSPDGKDPK
ncbi:hypothetical protein BGX31_001420 [Mortierella sp. GBA43]|nr:hypothetical protein BGX31_001420 [Mortierella sp. GBA43]